MTNEEAGKQLSELAREAVMPRWEQIQRIARDGDVAMLEHEVTDAGVLAYLARVRGRDTSPVFRVTRSKARIYYNDAQPALNAFTTTKAPAGHTRIVLWLRGVYVLVTHTPEGGFTACLEPDPAAGRALADLIGPPSARGDDK